MVEKLKKCYLAFFVQQFKFLFVFLIQSKNEYQSKNSFIMRKTVFIIAVAMGLTAPYSYATNRTLTSNHSLEVTKQSEISPFCMSIVKGDFETVKKLIGLGVDINGESLGLTPAMYAAKFNKVEILKFLVEHGADLKKKSDKGFTAKRYAQLSNAQDALEYLKSLDS